ncbi:hypothetical protein GS439_19650 [Rhodococcus hoagii]|nr:hypothetical protein [Prescottella equi]
MTTQAASTGEEAVGGWPGHYPPQCPPSDARPANGIYLRYVDTVPPSSDEDTKSHLELKLQGHPRYKNRDFGDPCMAAGYSVFDTPASAKQVLRIAKALRAKQLTRIDVTGSGVMKQTGSNQGHYTWWRPLGDTSWANSEILT